MPKSRSLWFAMPCSLFVAAWGVLAQAQEPPEDAAPVPAAPGDGATGQTPPVPPPAPAPVPPAPAAPAPASQVPVVPPPAPASDGFAGVRGKVTDEGGEIMVTAMVQVVETGDAVETDETGSFAIPVGPGTYTLEVAFPMFETRRVTVTVQSGQAAEITVPLALSQQAAEVIEVVGTIDRGSEGTQLQLRKNAAVVSDVLSSSEIARTPDSSASDAVKRVPSVTLEDGKYVLIRGLGDRYVSVLLNGVVLPSPEPDRQAVPLDLFPTSMLSNLTVMKSYSADLPGVFGGGALRIDTHAYPADFELKVKASTSADTSTSFQGIHGQSGGGLDFFGYDDGGRSLPAGIPADMPVDLMAPEDQERAGEAFANDWELHDGTAIPNLGLGAEIGDTVEIGKQRLGYLGAVSFGHKMRAVENETSKTRIAGGELQRSETLNGSIGMESASLSVLGNIGYELGAGHSINAITVYTHDGEALSSFVSGYDDQDSEQVEQTHLEFVERSLTFTQLTGSHQLTGAGNLKIDWQGNASLSTREEPDTRDIIYNVRPNGMRVFDDQPGSGERFFSALEQTTLGGGLDLTLPLAGLQLRAGAAAQRTEREFRGRSFFYRYDSICGDPAVLAMEPSELFSAANIGPTDDCSHSFALAENTLQSDGYQSTLDVLGTYAAVDAEVMKGLRVIAGARFEYADQELTSGTATAVAGMIDRVDRTDPAVLPSANVVYALAPQMNVRAGYSYTLARPQFRDLAPFIYHDAVERVTREGNPALSETRIHGADVRWEWFPGELDVFALGGFYKRFQDPIEQTIYNTAGARTFANADRADAFGAELEARTSLGRFTPLLDRVRIGANVALISSSVTLRPEQQNILTSRERPLQGQAPYVVNVNASYTHPALAEVTVLYNVIGASITDVASQGLPDIYAEPFHKLDMVARRQLRDDLTLKLAAANLLDASVERRQGDLAVFRYKPGVSFSLGLEWAP